MMSSHKNLLQHLGGNGLKRKVIVTAVLVLALMAAGCGKGDVNGHRGKPGTAEEETGLVEARPGTVDIRAEISECCKDIYEQSRKNWTVGSLETVREMVQRLGEKGYAVSDQDNQVNMENSELAVEFCRKVEEEQEGSLLLIVVLNNGGFVQFDLSTGEGDVDVSAKSLTWKENELVNIDTDNYRANAWIYPENGYLFFEKYYMEGFSGPYSHVVVRVQPLDDVCRDLNRKYIWPVGYHSNNMFITDWSETDYQDLNFYDMFEILYWQKNDAPIPYLEDDGGEIYRIPAEEFENILGARFDVDSQILREKTDYIGKRKVYEYRPRGLYDSGADTEAPYPEVIGYKERDGGMIELTVSAVWPEKNLGSAFRHKVVVRPLPDGGFQYVSNQVLEPEKLAGTGWYVNRLTEEEWKRHHDELK